MLKEEEIMQVEEVDCGEREEEVDDGDVGRSKMQLEEQWRWWIVGLEEICDQTGTKHL